MSGNIGKLDPTGSSWQDLEARGDMLVKGGRAQLATVADRHDIHTQDGYLAANKEIKDLTGRVELGTKIKHLANQLESNEYQLAMKAMSS